MSTVTVHDWGNDTELADLMDEGPRSGRVDASAQNRTNEDGVVRVTVHREHPSAGLLAPYNVVRLVGSDGEPRMAGFVSQLRDREVGNDEDELLEVQATGLLGLLDEAVVVPWVGVGRLPFSKDRVFNCFSPGYDRSSWINAYAQSRTSAVTQGLRHPIGWAAMSDTVPDWIWSAPDSNTQPVGRSPFHSQFTVANDVEVVPLGSWDNDGEWWLDGTLLYRAPLKWPGYNWWDTYKAPLRIPAGTHDFGIAGENWSTVGAQNPAAVIAGLWTTDGEQLLNLIHWTSTSWKCLHNPDPWPGWTFPDAFEVLLTEAQARGALPGWTVEVHGSHDEIPELVFPNGSTLRDVLRQGTETWVDAWADLEGLKLHLAPKGGRSQPSDVNLQRGVNITAMTRTVSI